MKIQCITSSISILLALGLAPIAHAQDRDQPVETGFYGGVSLRAHAREGTGLTFGPASSVWNRFVVPTTDDTSPRTLVFGGYRWSNDIAVEGAVDSLDK